MKKLVSFYCISVLAIYTPLIFSNTVSCSNVVAAMKLVKLIEPTVNTSWWIAGDRALHLSDENPVQVIRPREQHKHMQRYYSNQSVLASDVLQRQHVTWQLIGRRALKVISSKQRY